MWKANRDALPVFQEIDEPLDEAAFIHKFAFPHDKNLPAKQPQFSPVSSVTNPISFELRLPVNAIRIR